MPTIRIDELPTTVNPSLQHVFVAMKDGLTVQLSIQQIKALIVDGAPELLDTLDELSAAIGDDENFSTTMTTLIAGKLGLSGGTMTGPIDLGGNDLVNGHSPGSLIREPTIITSTSSAISLHASTRLIEVTLQAAGGAGGGNATTAASTAAAGGGGGGGECSTGYFDVSSLDPKQISISIGAGGVGVDGGDGGDGGNSTYSDGTNTMTANGGNGGSTSSANQAPIMTNNSNSGGDGGDGVINIPGEIGQPAMHAGDGGMAPYSIALPGRGGNSRFGVGGLPNFLMASSGSSDDGNAGRGFGSGGSGSRAVHGGEDRIGGSGTSGLAIIKEYA